jgi:hypothetical protein
MFLLSAVRARHTRRGREVAGLLCNVNGNEGEQAIVATDAGKEHVLTGRITVSSSLLGVARLRAAEDSERSREWTLTRYAVNISCGLSMPPSHWHPLLAVPGQ